MVLDGGMEKISKKEALLLKREQDKLHANLSGIKNMPGIPDVMFVIDVGYEDIAISEAVKLGIPVIGVVDSNNDPKGIDYVIPGNDDAIRSIRLYCKSIADAVLEAKESVAHLGDSGDENDFIELDEAGAPVVGTESKKSKIQTKKKIVKKKAAAAEAAPEPVVEAAAEAAPEPVAEAATAEPVVKKKVTKKKTVTKKVTKKKTVTKKTTKKKTT
jgi:small subunit ribosomal protein S2